jgi:hypothetical protein
MDDKRKNNGGHKTAGRKTKVQEEKANEIMLGALKELYNTETDEETKKAFVKTTLMESQRGQLFIGEHLFGKAPQEIKQTNLNIEAKDLDEKEIKKISDALNNNY